MTNRNIATSQVDYTAVEFNLTGFNKSTSLDYEKLGTIKMLVPNILSENSYKLTNEAIQRAAEAKFIEELRNYINPVLGLIKDYTDGLEITSKSLREGVDVFLRCSNPTFNFVCFEEVKTFKQMKKHVDKNPDYEEKLKKILTYIVVVFKKDIIEYALNKEKAAAAFRDKPAKPHSDGPFKIVALRVDSKHFPEPLIFDVMTGYLNKAQPHDDTPINRFMMAFSVYKEKTSATWQKNAISGSMNHETRKTYAQQLVDLEDLAQFLKSNEVTFTEVHRIPFPHYEREFSNHEFDIACGNLRKMLFRTNSIKFANLFSYWQMYNGTRHPGGVMH